MDTATRNQCWANLIMEELVRLGVTRCIIAPGARSAPLALAAARNAGMDTLVHFDERGAAFVALGCARVGSPAAVICTSGSAVANCFPAVVEADASALPLVVLSADRPPELHGCGANQTMNQHDFFQRHVRAFLPLPCPCAEISVHALTRQVDAALAAAFAPSPGPVHINCMFREPLTPPPDAITPAEPTPARVVWKPAVPMVTRETLETLGADVARARHGLLLLGRMCRPEEQQGALRLAEHLGWPCFADITSGGRVPGSAAPVIAQYDALLRNDGFRRFCAPDLIVHLGDAFVSKQLMTHIAALDCPYVQISPRPENRDPLHRVEQRLVGAIDVVCDQLIQMCQPRPCAYAARYLREAQSARDVIRQWTDEADAPLDELRVAAIVAQACTTGTALFAGNSMPVRNLDTVTDACAAAHVHANRGVSGIDGNIATAAGMAHGSGAPVFAMIGDTATLHDLNSLALLTRITAPVTLVIVNNRGGRIFERLPVAEHTGECETYFVNPHPWRFRDGAAMFGLAYTQVETAPELRAALATGAAERGSAIIEAIIDPETNKNALRKLD